MPVYVYRNLKTDETFEFKQSITESALIEHPETGDPVRRLVQPVGIAFKGSGFYVNDSRSKGTPSATSKSDSSADSASADSKAESKSDNKTETTSKADSKTEGPKKSESKPATKKAD